MALQIRRGLDAELVGIVPADGELLLTTDTQSLYAGVGGVRYQVGGPVGQLLVYATTAARDSAITSPSEGLTVYVTDGDGSGNPKFQGYIGGGSPGWVNLN